MVRLAALGVSVLAAVLTLACAPRPTPVSFSQLIMKQPVSIPDGAARAFIQEGTVVSRVDEFTPHCALEIRRITGAPRTIPAGTYRVTRIQDVQTPMVLAIPGQQFAGVGFGVNIGIGMGSVGIGAWGDSYADVFEGYHFWLADSAQVGLMRLTCLGARAQPVDVRAPTRAEMAHALGNLGALVVAP